MRVVTQSLVPTPYEPFSSDVKPEAASTFSRILLSFMTLVAHTYPCLEQRASKWND